jgi:Tol biopolymer transport system component
MRRLGTARLLVAATLLGSGCSDGTGPGGGGHGGNRIAFLTGANVGSMREDGSNRVMLTHDQVGLYDGASGPLQWSPDGTRLLVELTRQGPGGIADEATVVAGNGTAYNTVASVLEWGLGVGSWSPDGSRIAYYKAIYAHLGETVIYTANATGGGEAVLTTDPHPALTGGHHDWTPAWSPAGDEIAFVSDRTVPGAPEFQLHLFAVDTAGGQARQIVSEEVTDFDWSPDGQRFAIVQGGRIGVVNRDGTGAILLTQQSSVDTDPVWSPDGDRLAFQSIRDGNPELYVMNTDGTGVQRLTNHQAQDAAPAWSPDGTHLAFETDRDGNWEIYVIAVDGTGLTNLTRSPGRETTPAWR